MEIEKIQLEYCKKDGFISYSYDKVRHIKTLTKLTVVQAVEGDYDIKLADGETHNTGVAGFFIAPAYIQQTITHNADKHTNIMNCRWIALKIKVNDLYNFDDLYDFPIIIPENRKEEMNSLFNQLFAADNLFDEYAIYYKIIKLLFVLSKKKDKKFSPHVNNAIMFIKNNYKDKISIHNIAAMLNISESYLFSIFKKETGVSPITYLNNYRLSIAADELLKTNNSIIQICDMVGISDSIYFNKMFRNAYQMSPSKYRDLYKNSRR